MTGRMLMLGGAGAACLGLIVPAHAQEKDEDYRRIVITMRACATITDVSARVACYDNNISPPSGQTAGVVNPVQPARRVDDSPPATGFGADLLRTEREERASQTQEAELRVTSSREEQPGIHVLTLSDGAEWRFTDAATFSYEVPRAGDTVKLQRGALGSVQMHFDGQRGIRVQRIR